MLFSGRTASSLEPLEARIAPAILFSYVDVDGDKVTVKVSKGVAGDVTFNTAPSGLGFSLTSINFNGHTSLGKANVTVTSTTPAGGTGDGLAHVGLLDATGIDLRLVSVDGDLARIEAGDSNLATPGLTKLTVDSFRTVNVGTLDVTVGKLSHVQGRVSSLLVKHNMGASLSADSLGTATIKGSLIGTSNILLPAEFDYSGSIVTTGNIGSVTIAHDIVGGAGVSSGTVQADGKIGRLVVRGDMIGGTGSTYSGSIFAGGNIGALTILGDVKGGSQPQSGLINSYGNIGRVTLGSLYGGSANQTGELFAAGTISRLTIIGTLLGSSNSTTHLSETGYVQGERILVARLGSIISGTDNGPGLDRNGSVAALDDLGVVNVTGDLLGNSTNPVKIVAFGAHVPTAKTDLAIRSLTVVGDVSRTQFLAGYDVDVAGPGVNGDAQIGSLIVRGNWTASTAVAGVGVGPDGRFGTSDDIGFAGESSRIISRISRLIIAGTASGSLDPADASTFGIVAQQVGLLKLGQAKVPLKSGANNDTFALNAARSIGTTTGTSSPDGFDFHVAELSL